MTDPAAPTALDVDRVVSDYLATWNATDPGERRELLRRHWAPDATYVDPLAAVTGHEAIDAVVAEVHRQFPGMRFSPVGEPDGHHRQLRFQWGLGPDGTEPLVVGFDVVTVDDAGAVLDVRGFLDVVPPAGG